jgi:hypothetical protein
VKLLRASVLKSNQGPDWADWGFKQQLDWDWMGFARDTAGCRTNQ